MKHITEPGEFEGCYDFVPYFWKMSLEYFHDMFIDDDDYTHYIINFNDDDYTSFDIPKRYVKINMWKDDNGFVHAALLP